MSNPLTRYKDYGAFSEAYEIVRSAVIVMGDQEYRIDVLKSHWNPNDPYVTRCWRHGEMLKRHDLPWVGEKDAETALSVALSFLAEQSPRTS